MASVNDDDDDEDSADDSREHGAESTPLGSQVSIHRSNIADSQESVIQVKVYVRVPKCIFTIVPKM